MIHLSDNFVLTPTPGVSANAPLIGWRNLDSAIVADTEDPGFPAVNLRNPATYPPWRAADTSEQYLTLTLPESSEADYLGFARHNLGRAQIPVSVEVQVESEGSWEEIVSERLLANDEPALFRWVPGVLAGVRLRLQAGTDPAEIGALYCGRLTAVERNLYVGHTPIPMGRVLRMANTMSESGNFLGSLILGEHRSTSISLGNLTPAFVRNEMMPFLAAVQGKRPFFFAWRPADYPEEVGYVHITGEPRPVNQRPNGMMQIEMQVEGVA